MGGYQLMVASDIMRGRYRNSFSRPEAIPANSVQRFSVDLHQQLYTFGKGHRIMVQVQSSWFPLVDRNPQTFVDIYHARESDFRKATQRVYHEPGRASFVELPLITSAPGQAPR